MISKKPRLTLQAVFGVFLLAFAVVACNNSGDDKKDAASDSATVKPADTVTPASMDTASTRPVKPGN